MSLQLILIDTDLSADQFKSIVPMEAGPIEGLQSLENYIVALEGGNQSSDLTVKVGAVQASATITSTGTATNNETMLLLNQTITAKTSGAVAANGEFNISGTVATQATNIAAAINAMSTLSGKVTATSNAGIVTVKAVFPGIMGNGLQISESLSNVTVTAFSGGTNGTEYELASK